MKNNFYIFIFFYLLVANNSIAQCWKKLSAGAAHSIALRDDNTLWSFGNVSFGQLGISTQYNQFVPVRIGETQTTWKDISTKKNFNLAVKTNGTLWAWGYNYYGQLGLGSSGVNIGSMIPAQIGTDNDWKSVSAGGDHSIALKTDGTLWAWGKNSNRQVGDGTNINKTVPVKIDMATDWNILAAGGDHSLAIKTDGTLWGWGSSFYGQLGTGTTHINISIPTQIGSDNNWRSITAGENHSLALKTDGTLWAWGFNYYGQLGDGTNNDKATPTQVGTDNDWQAVQTGYGHTIAIKTDGTLWMWGRNDDGQLGIGTYGPATNVNTPISVLTASGWDDISAGYEHTLAISNDKMLWGWGQNFHGELGYGNGYAQYEPDKMTTLCNYATVSIVQGSNTVLTNDTYNMGSVDIGTSGNTVSFTITNSGNSNLLFTGTSIIDVSGINPSDFTVVQPPSSTLAPSSTTTFSVVFNPSASGLRKATLTILNNDQATSSFVIKLTGTGLIVPVPEIHLKQSSTSYLSSGNYSFGTQDVNTQNIQTFTIENTGTSSLVVSNITISGSDEDDFLLSALSLPLTITTGSSSSFSLTFYPLQAGSKSAVLTISSNDADESAYVLNLSGYSPNTIPSGILYKTVNDWSIFPNPSTDFITVNFGHTIPQHVKVAIKNMLGQTQKTFSATNLSALSLPLDGISPGSYIMEIVDEKGETTTYRLIKNGI